MSKFLPEIRIENLRRRGQAIVELVVALVVILVLLAGTIQVGWLGVHHSRAMTEARREAGVKAMLPDASFSAPRFIRDCTVGADGVAYSRDDGVVTDDPVVIVDGIVSYAHPAKLDGIRPDNAVSAISKGAFPEAMFGFVQGEKTDRVILVPVLRDLIYRADEVEVRGSAWLTWTKGIY